MNAFNLKGSSPQPKSLEEAQQVIDAVRACIGRSARADEPLEEQLRTDSGNSSKAPSSDSPRSRVQRRKRPRSTRAQGAQPGHEEHERAFVPESEVDAVERFFPAECDHCADRLTLQAEPVVRHQVFDLPEVRYQVTKSPRLSRRLPQLPAPHSGALSPMGAKWTDGARFDRLDQCPRGPVSFPIGRVVG